MKIIIEMSKGDSRRRHIKYDKSGFIDLGPIKEIIPVNDGKMPVNYGFFPETLNVSEGDEVDVLIISNNILEVGGEFDVRPIAIMRREDGDDKIVAADASVPEIEKWEDISEEERTLIKSFFSYHYKFIIIEGAVMAKEYLENARRDFIIKENEKKL